VCRRHEGGICRAVTVHRAAVERADRLDHATVLLDADRALVWRPTVEEAPRSRRSAKRQRAKVVVDLAALGGGDGCPRRLKPAVRLRSLGACLPRVPLRRQRDASGLGGRAVVAGPLVALGLRCQRAVAPVHVEPADALAGQRRPAMVAWTHAGQPVVAVQRGIDLGERDASPVARRAALCCDGVTHLDSPLLLSHRFRRGHPCDVIVDGAKGGAQLCRCRFKVRRCHATFVDAQLQLGGERLELRAVLRCQRAGAPVNALAAASAHQQPAAIARTQARACLCLAHFTGGDLGGRG